RQQMIAASDLGAAYAKEIDRESAHEILSGRAQAAAAEEQRQADADAQAKAAAKAARQPRTPAPPPPPRASSSRTTPLERQTGRVASGVLNTVARELMRGILGTGAPRRRR